MVRVVEVRVITLVIAHHDSTGSCALSTCSPIFFIPETSVSMRAKLCTRAMFPSVSVVRSITSVNCPSTLLCSCSLLRITSAITTAKVAHSAMRRRP